MADQEDVRRLALALPGTSAAADRFAFSVRGNGKARAFARGWTTCAPCSLSPANSSTSSRLDSIPVS
jgi:hypothetical protein